MVGQRDKPTTALPYRMPWRDDRVTLASRHPERETVLKRKYEVQHIKSPACALRVGFQKLDQRSTILIYWQLRHPIKGRENLKGSQIANEVSLFFSYSRPRGHRPVQFTEYVKLTICYNESGVSCQGWNSSQTQLGPKSLIFSEGDIWSFRTGTTWGFCTVLL